MPALSRRAFAALALPLAAGACAQARVEPLPTPAATPAGAEPAERLPRPVEVVVERFRLEPGRVTLDSAPLLRAQRAISGDEGQQRAAAAREAQAAFADALVAALRERGLAAVRTPTGATERPRLTVQGEFSALEEGNRARRTVVGFGLGASRVAGEAQLLYGDGTAPPRQVDRFALEADSGNMPGGVVGAGAGVRAVALGAAVRGAAGEARGPQEIGTLARSTADRIAAFARLQGWI